MSLTTQRLLEATLEPVWEVFPHWQALRAQTLTTLTDHGDARRWDEALTVLPGATPSSAAFEDIVTIGDTRDIDAAEQVSLAQSLAALHPWRKGPFSLFGIRIDAEWQSNWKWKRIAPHLESLQGKRVLDVGCGNGYYGWRIRASGASLVVGIEANPVHVMQHLVMCRYLSTLGHTANCILPVRFEALAPAAPFDTVFSLGVLYHQHDPVAHLRALRSRLREGGELVVETLVVAGDTTLKIAPGARYARMRNVSCIPGEGIVMQWLSEAGFHALRCVNLTATSIAEQRRTKWMTFESLIDALDRNDASRTVEGHPAPVRAVFLAKG